MRTPSSPSFSTISSLGAGTTRFITPVRVRDTLPSGRSSSPDQYVKAAGEGNVALHSAWDYLKAAGPTSKPQPPPATRSSPRISVG